jgi:formate-dependent nitrite reductase cytochrome c552 subunit
MTRRAMKEAEVFEILLAQGAVIECAVPWCRRLIKSRTDCQRDHYHALKLGGEDVPSNMQYICLDCHKLKTNGTKATTAGSDKARIAKVKRITSGGRKRRGRKITGRPLPANRGGRFKKKMSGEVVER